MACQGIVVGNCQFKVEEIAEGGGEEDRLKIMLKFDYKQTSEAICRSIEFRTLGKVEVK